MFRNFQISKIDKQTLFIICTFLFLYAFSTVTPAGTGTGTGTGTSTDKKPVNFIGAYLTTINGNTSSTEAEVTTAPVPLKPTIKIAFDKNVVYDSIWSNNEQSLNILTSTGVKVPAQVFKISDQVNFEERQYIFITPLQELNPGTGYKIVISPGLQAKSKTTIGMTTNNQPVIIEFTTQAEAISKTSEEKSSTNNNVNAPGFFEKSKEKLSITSLVSYIIAGTFLLLGCLWIAVRWFNKKRQ